MSNPVAARQRPASAPAGRGGLPVHLSNRVSAWHLVTVVAAVGVLVMVVGPVKEADVFWHIAVGRYFLHGHAFPAHDPWAYTLPGRHWHSDAWLSEVVLAATYKVGGFTAISALRMLLTVVLLAALARELCRGRTVWVGAVVFAAAVAPLPLFIQERPELASFIFLVWLGRICMRVLFEHAPPSRWRVVVLTWLWANIHGYWTFVPAALVLATLCGLAQERHGTRAWVRPTLVTAAAAALAGGLTPAGPRLYLAPLQVSRAARDILEWAPAQMLQATAYGVLALLVVLLLCWGRSTEPAPRSELLWTLAWAAFSLVAVRNLAVATLLLAPVAVRRLQATYGDLHSRALVRPLVPAVILVLGLFAVVVAQIRQPALGSGKPTRIAAFLRHQPGAVRVLDDYNVGGFLILATAGHARVAIDGRADRYGYAFIHHYLEMESGSPGWDRSVAQLRPQFAVLDKTSGLVYDLVHIEHWKVLVTERVFTLLEAPHGWA